MSIQTSCLARSITIGDRQVHLAPPTVRQAVEIMHVLARMEDKEDKNLLFELLSGLGWQGAPDIIIILRNQYRQDPFGFARFLKDILLQGYDPEEQTRRAAEKQEPPKDPKPTDWKILLSEYCRAYPGKDTFAVYNEVPFPFFMEMLPEARREIARRHIHRALEAGAGFGGGKEIMESWQKQAGYKTETEHKADKYSDEMTPEQIKQERQSFQNRMSR